MEGGRLPEVLRASQTYHELRQRLARQMAMMAVYLATGVLVFGGALAVIFGITRRMKEDYQNVRVSMPALSLWLVWCADHSGSLLAIAALGAGVAAGMVALLRRFGFLGRAIYLVPIWGPIRRTRDLALLATTLSVRLGGGAPVASALRSGADVVRNPRARRACARAASLVEEGRSLSEALFYLSFFPRTLAWAVSLGEQRSDVASVFDDFARIYSGDLERRFGVLFQILSPLGVIVMAQLALCSAIALFLPLISLLEGIGTKR